MRTIRRLLATLAWFGVFFLVGANAPAPQHRVGATLVDFTTGLSPLLGTFLNGMWASAAWAVTHPWLMVFVAALWVVPVLAGPVLAAIPRRVHKDPQRMFTSEQRRFGGERAGGRCEMEGVFFTRCTRPGEHGDHWFPHSKGGASTMNNFVWACAPCNLSKSAHVPTFWETTRLEWRRRRYFDQATQIRPGEKVRAR